MGARIHPSVVASLIVRHTGLPQSSTATAGRSVSGAELEHRHGDDGGDTHPHDEDAGELRREVKRWMGCHRFLLEKA